MGKKLTREEQINSEIAVNSFIQLCKSYNSFLARVTVSKNNDVIFDEKDVTINIFEKPSWWEINILWEYVGLSREEYRGLGLFGSYSSGYYEMQYNGISLIINSDNGIQIAITV